MQSFLLILLAVSLSASDALRLRSLRRWPSSRQPATMDRNLLVSLNSLVHPVKPMGRMGFLRTQRQLLESQWYVGAVLRTIRV